MTFASIYPAARTTAFGSSNSGGGSGGGKSGRRTPCRKARNPRKCRRRRRGSRSR